MDKEKMAAAKLQLHGDRSFPNAWRHIESFLNIMKILVKSQHRKCLIYHKIYWHLFMDIS